VEIISRSQKFSQPRERVPRTMREGGRGKELKARSFGEGKHFHTDSDFNSKLARDHRCMTDRGTGSRRRVSGNNAHNFQKRNLKAVVHVEGKKHSENPRGECPRQEPRKAGEGKPVSYSLPIKKAALQRKTSPVEKGDELKDW